MKVSESGKGKSWILLLHTEVTTIRIGGMSWILSSMLLHSGVSAIATGGDWGGEYYFESTACRSIKSSFTE